MGPISLIMLRIRLFRMGKRNQPFFRIVVIEKKSPPRGGRPLEIVGFYNPLTKEKKFKKDRIEYWLSSGAQASDTVHNMLVVEGIIKEKKKPVHKKKKAKKTEVTGATKATEAIKETKEKPEKVEEKKPVQTPSEIKTDKEKTEKKPEPTSAEDTVGKEEKKD